MIVAGESERKQVVAGVALGACAGAIALIPDPSTKVLAAAAVVGAPAFLWIAREPGRWLTVFFLTAVLLPPFPVDLGDAGPHIAVAVALCGLLIGFIHCVPIVLDRLSLQLCALFAAIAGSVALAGFYSGPAIAAASMARVLLFGISVYVFFLVRSGVASFQIVRVMFWAAVGSALFACLDFYFQFPAPGGYGPQFIWLESGVFRRAQGLFYEASTLGNLCAFFLEMIAVALFLPRGERPFSLVGMLTGGVSLASALVLSYSRASLLNVAVALIVLLWLHRKRVRPGRFLLATAILGAVASAILLGLFPRFARAYWLRLAQSFSYLLESPNAILSGRIHSWTVLTQFLIEHPWHAILGIGYKTLPYSDFIGQTAIADNTYLSMLIETGLAGFCALLVWNAAVIRASYRAAKSNDPQRSFLGAWMLCFWSGQIVQMFSADLLTYWRVLPVYMCVFALAVRRK